MHCQENVATPQKICILFIFNTPLFMFGKRSMFRVPKHQQFEYKPMYYDPKKEELQERLKQLEELQQQDVEGTKARISSGLRGGYLSDQTYRRNQVLRSNLTLIAVIAMLAILGYFVLSVYLPELTKMLE
jgi:hypothetical protein